MALEQMAGKAANEIDERYGSANFVKRSARKIFPDHWSFMLGEIALYSFIILLLTGVFLSLWFKPSHGEVIYNGSYIPLRGLEMSEAYASTLEISFDVRGGLIIRQIHHWAALIFVAAMVVHMCRVFFTGAFRKPRETNWIIGVTLLTLSFIEGLAGYSLPDDLLSGTGLRITEGVLLSLPVVGTYLSYFLFGGQFPGDDIIPRLYTAHVLLIPGVFLADGHRPGVAVLRRGGRAGRPAAGVHRQRPRLALHGQGDLRPAGEGGHLPLVEPQLPAGPLQHRLDADAAARVVEAAEVTPGQDRLVAGQAAGRQVPDREGVVAVSVSGEEAAAGDPRPQEREERPGAAAGQAWIGPAEDLLGADAVDRDEDDGARRLDRRTGRRRRERRRARRPVGPGEQQAGRRDPRQVRTARPPHGRLRSSAAHRLWASSRNRTETTSFPSAPRPRGSGAPASSVGGDQSIRSGTAWSSRAAEANGSTRPRSTSRRKSSVRPGLAAPPAGRAPG